MFRKYPDEVFKEVDFGVALKRRYAISNRGRLVSYTDHVDNGTIVKGSRCDGYVSFKYKIRQGNKIKNKAFLIYKLVAEHFIPKTSEDQKYVIHLDYVRDHDDVRNLRWVTYEEKMDHYRKSPRVIAAKQKLVEHNIKSDGRKLSVTTVLRIKKMLKNPKGNTRKSMIAKQFGISHTHLNRIISGENWGHLDV